MKRGALDTLMPLAWMGAAILLFLYSYTQVDLSLTLSRLSIYQTIEKGFQYIGYYQRPLSTVLFIGLVGIFFALYYSTMRAVKMGKVTLRGVQRIIAGLSVMLVLSYPAFSYDIFNYMFDAKTVLVYHKIPYLVTPLQFTGVEPWLSFMHWTHVPSTFMPFWIILSLPAYLLGFGYFLGTLWSFKVLMAVAYITTSWFILKILKRLDPARAALGLVIFALNPLVIVESLVSGHFDIVMMAFAMISYFLYIQKKRLVSFVFLAFSAATKIMTITLLPLFLMGWQRSWSWVATLIGFIFFIAITGREILPWYFIWFMPWIALLPREKWLRTIGTGISAGLLLTYAPFLYYGDYQPPVTVIKQWTVITFFALALAWAGIQFIRSGRSKPHLPSN